MQEGYYREIRSELRTGDICLFSGKGGISAGIKWATFNRWSHVGMVLRLEEYDFVTLWESTTLSSLRDLDTGQARKGVQLVPMSQRVATYSGDIAVRRLEGVSFSQDDVASLMELRQEVKGRPYEEDKIELIKAAYDGPFGLNDEDLSSLFCSELVAEAYQRLGLLPESPPSNEYVPADFSQARDERLGPEIILREG